jgi:hypothetical protein
MTSPPRDPSRWWLERYVLDELPSSLLPETRRTLEQHASKERAAELQASTERFLERYPPERMVPSIRARLDGARNLRRASWSVGALAFASTVLVLVLTRDVPRVEPATSEGAPAVERLKGLPPSLAVFRKREAAFERLTPDASVQPGDVLQLRYAAAGHGYGAIVAVDGARKVTLLHPAEAGLEPVLDPSGDVALPFGYQLDDAPGFERFLFITSDTPFPVEQILDVVQDAARAGLTEHPLPLPPSFEQASFTLRKTTP